MADMFEPVKLVPVSEWEWHLYEVKFWDKEPWPGDKPRKSQMCVCTDTMIDQLADEQCALIGGCIWYSWKLIKQNVARPRQIGHIYGMRLSEDGWAAGSQYNAAGEYVS